MIPDLLISICLGYIWSTVGVHLLGVQIKHIRSIFGSYLMTDPWSVGKHHQLLVETLNSWNRIIWEYEWDGICFVLLKTYLSTINTKLKLIKYLKPNVIIN